MDYKKDLENFANLVNMIEEEEMGTKNEISEEGFDIDLDEEMEPMNELIGTLALGAIGAKLFRNRKKLSGAWDDIKSGKLLKSGGKLWNTLVTSELEDAAVAFQKHLKKNYSVEADLKVIEKLLVRVSINEFEKSKLKGKDIDEVSEKEVGGDHASSGANDQEDSGAEE